MSQLKAELEGLYQQCSEYFSGLYASEAKPLVFGSGDPGAPVLLVGEAPGAQEALSGKPFVGKAGKMLDDFLAAISLERNALFITNTVKVRPTAVSKAGRTVNRAPSKEEIALFLPWLLKEVALLQPDVIVTLGNVPLGALSGIKGAAIGALHGTLLKNTPCGIPVFALYHPAALIYNQSLKACHTRDLAALRAHLALSGVLKGRELS